MPTRPAAGEVSGKDVADATTITTSVATAAAWPDIGGHGWPAADVRTGIAGRTSEPTIPPGPR